MIKIMKRRKMILIILIKYLNLKEKKEKINLEFKNYLMQKIYISIILLKFIIIVI